jgi:serine protease Do
MAAFVAKAAADDPDVEVPAAELTVPDNKDPAAQDPVAEVPAAEAVPRGGSDAAAVDDAPGQVVALEAAIVAAIARCDKSVVAIARGAPGIDTARGRGVRGEGSERRGASGLGRPTDIGLFFPREFGTGVVIDANGLILTQHHVLQEGDDHWVTTPDGRVFEATIRGADPRSDLAVLVIEADDLVPIALGDAAALRKGQIVIALGNPYAIARDGQASASWGIVSNLARKAGPLPADDPASQRPTLHHFGTLIQTDAKLNLGTSGGALINVRGEMVGLTTSVAAIAGYEQAAGYAVPIDETFRRVIAILSEGREVEYGLLGVRPENIAPREGRNVQAGVAVREIVPGTPADWAGLQPGDRLVALNGRPVQDADQFVLEVSRLFAGSTVRLTIERESRSRDVELMLAKYPVRGTSVVSAPRPGWRGIRVDYATAGDYQRHVRDGRVDLDGCVLITDVQKESVAWQAGLRPEMFISHFDGQRVRSPQEFLTAASRADGTVRLRLTASPEGKPDTTMPEVMIPP